MGSSISQDRNDNEFTQFERQGNGEVAPSATGEPTGEEGTGESSGDSGKEPATTPHVRQRQSQQLDEAIPTDQVGIRRQVEMALSTAEGEPDATQLAAATYGADRIVALRALLGALDTLIAAQAAAQHAAKQVTIVRDAAVRDVILVSRQIQAEVNALLRRNPHLTAPVGF